MLGSFAAQAHDYHTSITEVKFNPHSQSLEVAVKVFTDDLENALTKRAKSKVQYQASSVKVNALIAAYLKSSLVFELTKGKALNHRFVGSEEEGDAVWLYLEIPIDSNTLDHIYISNTVLTELFSDQMNIVNVTYNGKISSVLQQPNDPSKKFTF
jgi:hypothetical protein